MSSEEDDPTEASGTQRIGMEVRRFDSVGEDSTRLEERRSGGDDSDGRETKRGRRLG